MKIVVIHSSSRGGSSLFKEMLMQSPDVSGLAGEEEPYLRLTGNCYPYNPSDEIDDLVQVDTLRKLILDELNETDMQKAWKKRLRLQFPGREFPDIFGNVDEWLEEQQIAGYYDGTKERKDWDIRHKYEEPPYVKPIKGRGTDKLVIFKAPSNAYRPNLYERLFPEADVRYIWLTRNPCSSINGLIDGWMSRHGFFSHFIDGFGWWKFDLFPEWREYIEADVPDKCAMQWLSAHQHIYEQIHDRPHYRVKFEDVIQDTNLTMFNVFYWLDLPAPKQFKKPMVMSTAKPRPHRWHDRASVIVPIVDRFCREMMISLEYTDERKFI